MVDPTWSRPCPACGEIVKENMMGQVYGHKGRNGCTYRGTGHPRPEHIENVDGVDELYVNRKD